LCASQTENKDCFGDSCACNPDARPCSNPELIGQGDGGVNQYRPDVLMGNRLSMISSFVIGFITLMFFL